MVTILLMTSSALRLWPVVPLNSRFANKNTTIPVGGGPDGKSPIFIPKGRGVSYSVYSMHRRTDIYGADAEEFKPERWETLRVGWGYLPFNGGPRICVGQQFALTEAGYTIVRLMQTFDFVEARDARPWNEGLQLTMSVGNGVKVALMPKETK
jgi:cytochrome P450